MVDSTSIDTEMVDSPMVTTRLVPSRSTSRADSGAVTIIVIAYGISRTPACSGAVAVHELPVLRHQEQRAEQREERQRDRRVRRREPWVLEEAHVEHRVIGAPLPGDERSRAPTMPTANAASDLARWSSPWPGLR